MGCKKALPPILGMGAPSTPRLTFISSWVVVRQGWQGSDAVAVTKGLAQHLVPTRHYLVTHAATTVMSSTFPPLHEMRFR